MKKLLIIVPKGTLLNSYLMNQFYVYEKIADAEDVVYYKQIKQIGILERYNPIALSEGT